MYNVKDNIVSLATTPGRSALNVVRCSGPGSLNLYFKLTKTKKTATPNCSHLKSVYYNDDILDEMMVTYFKGPKSYTGQDMLEFSMLH